MQTHPPIRVVELSLGAQRKFMDFVFKDLNFQKAEDWYKISNKDIYARGGR